MIFQDEIRDGKRIAFPLAFFSLRFNETQQRYSTVERELFAVLHVLEHAPLMLSSIIRIYTDNQGIVSIGKTSRATHPRFAKFLDILNTYRLDWKHLPGVKNVLADFLSRYALEGQPELDLEKWDRVATDIPTAQLTLAAVQTLDGPNALSSSSTPPNNWAPLQTNGSTTPLPPPERPARSADWYRVVKRIDDLRWTEILKIKEVLSDRSVRIPKGLQDVIGLFHLQEPALFVVRDAILFRVIVDHDYLDLAKRIHKQVHCSPRVLQIMMDLERVWNPNHKILGYDAVHNCSDCEKSAKFRDLPAELPDFRPTPIFSRWHLDFAGPFQVKDSSRYFLVAADYTSNLVLVTPAQQQTAKVVVGMLKRIVATFGFPKLLVTDNGSPLANEVVETFAKKGNIHFVNSSAYHPRGNGKAERSVQMIKSALKKVSPHMDNWDADLYWAATIVNNTPMVYGYSPREIAFGVARTKNNIRLDKLADGIRNDATFREEILNRDDVEFALMNHKVFEKARADTFSHRTKIREALKRARKDGEVEIPYEKGDLVLRWRAKKNKTEPTWDGPYRILEQTAPNTYRIVSLDGRVKRATL